MAIPADNDLAVQQHVEGASAGPPPAARETGCGEARRFPRVSFRGRARAIVFPLANHAKASKKKNPAKEINAKEINAEPQECEVLTTDVSRGGLSLLYRKQLRPGQQILLLLDQTSRLVEVCWCCRVWAGLYAAGCQFIDAAADDSDS